MVHYIDNFYFKMSLIRTKLIFSILKKQLNNFLQELFQSQRKKKRQLVITLRYSYGGKKVSLNLNILILMLNYLTEILEISHSHNL